ncbi:MAG: hypothetical protein K0Q76_937 [Panacagrimonas sp.]|jgi:hypothetical protein|nr:hypothetical protein [Panacagrimonas sp.]MCC2655829.1 hypothetical protein [Panacagrimonas sp.]
MTVERALHRRFALSLSAASGVVLRNGVALVVGDDRVGLDRYDLSDGAALAPIPLLAGHGADATLPKPEKPDLEALAEFGDGTLVALGSGSRPNRDRGFRIAGARVQALDLSPLYTQLRRDIPDLNIEGAALESGDTLVLAHRGVGRSDASQLIRLDARVLRAASRCDWPASALLGVRHVDLGALDGIALAFTDLAPGPDGALHFLAAAEDTDDPYRDGQCRGSVLGRLEHDGRVRTLARLSPVVKAEGLAYSHRSGADDTWVVVTDADDPSLRAWIYELRIPHR